MLWSETPTRIRVSKLAKDGDKFFSVFASSSTKKRGEEKYTYSNWVVTFVGDAKQMQALVGEGSVLTIKKWAVSNEKYEKGDGTTVWNNPKLLVLDFEVYRTGSGSGELPEQPEEDDIPF